MKKANSIFGRLLIAVAGVYGFLAMATQAKAQIYTNMVSGLETHITEATSAVSTLALAGLAIFAIIWGIRKFKQAVKAGA